MAVWKGMNGRTITANGQIWQANRPKVGDGGLRRTLGISPAAVTCVVLKRDFLAPGSPHLCTSSAPTSACPAKDISLKICRRKGVRACNLLPKCALGLSFIDLVS